MGDNDGNHPEGVPYMGMRVYSSLLMKPGIFIFRKGKEVVGVATADRAKFLGQFGLAPVPPPEADNVVISREDYLALLAASS